ncbi:MAG: ABC transporter ATP-binding protein [Dehalococcoidia bacterium]|nr:ABC transporter ATP-binding protein [Dehalococcoidia bacterium]
MFGFLGANGAGKTTTLLMLLGLTEPTSGVVRVCGKDPSREPIEVKRQVGYLPERIGFYEELSARENLRFTAELNQMLRSQSEPKIDDVLGTVGLGKVKDQTVSTFSRGMKQRLGIAEILLKEPRLAFLDEATTGIDPNGIDDIMRLITGMGKRGITVIFCSHVLPQVQQLCSRVGIMSKGNLVADGPIDLLGRSAAGGGLYRMEAEVDDPRAAVVDAVRGVKGVQQVEVVEKTLMVTAESDLRGLVSKAIIDSGGLLLGMRIEEYNLDKIYKRYSKEA